MLGNEDGVQMLLQMNVTFWPSFAIFPQNTAIYQKIDVIFIQNQKCSFEKFVTKKIMLGNYIMQNYVPKIL